MMKPPIHKQQTNHRGICSRPILLGVLVLMLVGIIFPLLTAGSVESPEIELKERDQSSTASYTDSTMICNKDYSNPKITASKDPQPYNDSEKSTAAAWGILPFLAPFYSKLAPDAVLANQSRAALYNMVCSQPGITFGTLARVLAIAPGTAEYHLRILEREGYIRARKCGKFIRYYPYEMKTCPYTPVQQKILNSLAIEPDLSQTDLAEKVGVSKQVVNYNIKQLRSFGVLSEAKQGTKLICRLNAESPYGPNAL